MSSLCRTIVLGLLLTSGLTSWVLANSMRDQIPAMIKSLDDPNVRYGASLALTNLGTEAVPGLRQSLRTGKGDVAVWSAYTLGQIGPAAQPAVEDLVKCLASPDDALRSAAAQALGKIGPTATAAVKPLAKALNDTNQTVRKRAIVALGQIGPAAKSATNNLIIALSDNQLRKFARTALIQIGPAAEKPLLESLDNNNIRFDISVVLLNIDPESARKMRLDKPTDADLPGLRFVLNDLTRDPQERAAAATALASLGKTGIPILVTAFEVEQIARPAAKAFSKIGAVAVPSLVKSLSHKNPQVRMTAADALGHIGPDASEAVSDLIGLLNDDDRDVRYHVVRALHTFGPKAKPAVPALIEVINNSRESEPTRQWAIKTLIVTLPETHDEVVKALIAVSKVKGNYGVSQLARQEVRRIDPKAAEEAGVK